MNNKELFEKLKECVRCDYISDLRYAPWKNWAREAIMKMELSSYSMSEICDAAEYLYAETVIFDSFDDAMEYFRKKFRGIQRK